MLSPNIYISAFTGICEKVLKDKPYLPKEEEEPANRDPDSAPDSDESYEIRGERVKDMTNG